MEYTANFSHGENDVSGVLNLSAKTDDEAMDEVCNFVAQGYRNRTAASTELSDGSTYQAWNAHGQAKARRMTF